jgi:hypothetical protein
MDLLMGPSHQLVLNLLNLILFLNIIFCYELLGVCFMSVL